MVRTKGSQKFWEFEASREVAVRDSYRAVGTIHFLDPDFGVAAAFGLSNNVAPGFSYNSDRTTGGVKVSLLDTEVGTVRVTRRRT